MNVISSCLIKSEAGRMTCHAVKEHEDRGCVSVIGNPKEVGVWAIDCCSAEACA